MQNQSETKKGTKGSKSSKTDKANKEVVKDSLLEKRGIDARKNLYSFKHEGMTGEEQKKFRSKIRRDLARFCNQILGIDRSEEERGNALKEFLTFYRKTWKINDFRIENFTQKKNDEAIEDYRKILLIAEDFSKGGILYKKGAKKGE